MMMNAILKTICTVVLFLAVSAQTFAEVVTVKDVNLDDQQKLAVIMAMKNALNRHLVDLNKSAQTNMSQEEMTKNMEDLKAKIDEELKKSPNSRDAVLKRVAGRTGIGLGALTTILGLRKPGRGAKAIVVFGLAEALAGYTYTSVNSEEHLRKKSIENVKILSAELASLENALSEEILRKAKAKEKIRGLVDGLDGEPVMAPPGQGDPSPAPTH